MEEIKDSLNIALEIINTLLQNKEIKKSENTELYQQYVGNDEVERFKIKVTDFIMSQSTKDIEKYSKKFSSLL